MLQKYNASIKVISNLINVLTPDVIALIEANCGAERAVWAQQSKDEALAFCRNAKYTEAACIHSGFAEIEDKRVEVSFPTPSDATKVEIDSAFLAYLAEKMTLGYELTTTMSGL